MIHTETLKYLDPHWILSIHTGIPESILDSQNPYWNPRIPNGIPNTTLEPQDPHLNPNIHTGIQESTLDSQDPNWNPRIHTLISVSAQSKHLHWNLRIQAKSILKSLDALWNTKFHTGLLGFTPESQNPHCKSGIPAEIHWNSLTHITIHTGIKESTLKYQSSGSTLVSQDPHCNPTINTTIPRSTLEFQVPHWNSPIHNTVPGFTLKYYDLHNNSDIQTVTK